jgi:hypothetical protein
LSWPVEDEGWEGEFLGRQTEAGAKEDLSRTEHQIRTVIDCFGKLFHIAARSRFRNGIIALYRSMLSGNIGEVFE